MLQELLIAGAGSYSDAGARLSGCKAINFVFGANGSGKTTISRVIASPENYPSCQLSWAGGRKIESLVYNSDFAERNFASNIPGIFTLGQESAETLAKITELKANEGQLVADVGQLSNTLSGQDGTGGKQGELAKLRTDLEGKCWGIKQIHDGDFQEAFTGYRNSKSSFCDKVLAELSSNTSDLHPLDELNKRAATVYAAGLERHPHIFDPTFTDLLELEVAPILGKRIIGKEDVDIAALISRLGNSDWVREGRGYWESSKPQCPFCQQKVVAELGRNLAEYFDESYVQDIASVDRLLESHQTNAELVRQRLAEIIALDSRHVDNEALRAAVDRLNARLVTNFRLLETKRKEPSSVVVLEKIEPITEVISQLLAQANDLITTHNAMVENLAAEKNSLGGQIWKRLLEDASELLKTYVTASEGLAKAIDGISSSITKKQGELSSVRAGIVELERSITSVQPTVSEINSVLASFGFSNFRLTTTGDRNHLYAIVRPDGSDATKTLSEGERSFITFLYFYNLTRGSITESGMTADRIVVFDDPVSSLDSDVLFIVSTLIKRILDQASAEKGQIKQVFVLTHNIYFHKEVSFDARRGKECRSHETFSIVRKESNESRIISYDHNPIKTSYELLWSEVRNPSRSKMTIQNTLRRILENYFKILGNLDRDEIVALFEGREKQICGSLFSWVNDGSHAVHDDIYVSADDGAVDSYLKVFKNIFVQTGHVAHYEMMMGTHAASASPPLPIDALVPHAVLAGEPITVPEIMTEDLSAPVEAITAQDPA